MADDERLEDTQQAPVSRAPSEVGETVDDEALRAPEAVTWAGDDSAELGASLRKHIRGWAWGLLVIGAISIVASRFLNPFWGGLLIVGGIVGFFVKHRGMLIAFGVVLLLAAAGNIFSSSVGWIAFGALQVYWAIQEFRQYRHYAGVSLKYGGASTAPLPRGMEQSRLGIASLIAFVLAAACGLGFLLSAIMATRARGGYVDQNQAPPLWVMVLWFAYPLLALLGVALGIAGVVQRLRSRILAIVALCLNGGLLLIYVLAIVLIAARAQTGP